MPTKEWMDEVNAWSETRRELRARIREATTERDEVEDNRYEGGSYVWNLLIAIDQLGNAIAGGNADETISSRIGKAKLAGDLSLAGKALDLMLDKIDSNHSIDAIEHDEGHTLEVTAVDHNAKSVTFESRFRRDSFED